MYSISIEESDIACYLFEADCNDTVTQLRSDKHCIRLDNLMKGKDSKFSGRDLYAYGKGWQW